jgi:hypothetical protein
LVLDVIVLLQKQPPYTLTGFDLAIPRLQ